MLKANMVPPEPSRHTTGRLGHPNPEDIEEIDFKCYLIKMMETGKEEVKNSIKEWGRRQAKS